MIMQYWSSTFRSIYISYFFKCFFFIVYNWHGVYNYHYYLYSQSKEMLNVKIKFVLISILSLLLFRLLFYYFNCSDKIMKESVQVTNELMFIELQGRFFAHCTYYTYYKLMILVIFICINVWISFVPIILF